MKKLTSIILSISILASLFVSTVVVYADSEYNSLIQDGSYVQLGSYNGEPILWRCVSTDDENGKLILSDRILCYKAYDSPRYIEHEDGTKTKYDTGYGYWGESNIRTWLNSKEKGGNINWIGQNPPTGLLRNGGDPTHGNTKFAYDQEDGFLSDTNFTESERSVMKSVGQWLILPYYESDRVTNGYTDFFARNTIYSAHTTMPMGKEYTDLSQLSHVEGAMCRTVDTVFLIDEIQAYSLWKKYDAYSEPREDAKEKFHEAFDMSSGFYQDSAFWLRTGGRDAVRIVYGSSTYTSRNCSQAIGVRPAFYLDEDNVRVLSGSGEWYDPYVLDGYGQNDTAVYTKGEKIDVSQILVEDDEVLLPVRDVFEAFGADVQYYDVEDGIITATSDERVVALQVGNQEIGNGTDVITLKTPPVIVNDRAMISLEGIEGAYECTTECISELNRIVIDKPDPQVFDDGYGFENWQQYRAIRNGTYQYIEE